MQDIDENSLSSSSLGNGEDEPSKLTPLGHSYYASSTFLTPQFYEDLISRGWRRSGTTLYKPDLRNSCCPHYTIRLDSLAYKPTKDQRQTQNRFNHHIRGDSYIRACARLHPKSRAAAKRYKQEFDLVERVHETEYTALPTPPDPAHNLEVTLEPANFTEEKYLLFENYQRIVHHEPPSKISQRSFSSFLCSSPIESNEEQRLGSYHQCYRLDGVLVAVGVLDLLPHVVSGVYFMYHESIHTWSPGKLGALSEIALAREEGRRWYMMGYYIHGCAKMRYKAGYGPQWVLDPESYTWDVLDKEFRTRLDGRKYVSLSAERRDENKAGADISGVAGGTSSAQETLHDASPEQDQSNSPSSSSLLASMPGIMTRAEISDQVDLDSIRLLIRGYPALTSDLFAWEDEGVNEQGSLKCMFADFVAVLGAELAGKCVVTLG